MKKLLYLPLIALLYTLLSCSTAHAHGDEKHEKTASTAAEVLPPDSTHTQPTVTAAAQPAQGQDAENVRAALDDFPNRHPLFVHFPIVLLLVAAAVQLANTIFLKKELDWITTSLTIVSFVMAYYVAEIAHPHTSGLTERAKQVLEQHDFYAEWTIYLSGIAAGGQLLNQFLFKGKRWSIIAVTLLLAGAAYFVSMAGHYGAQLVHIEGVGPQGNYLEAEHGH
ncbi:hypothetical protein MKJ04_00850 [Pontibacter sp. E15-1]|uniref:DUF2231 domain-containing protein n=1 Tax=Pontibacter sp. E15-1 TaxID=2919918 RepID=UPI001F4FDDBF|nr:DUF2231 domain-containing protein [Pontibacter sp. E15-1]MCJ8163370.1 hypothetical protein [Pontibacter sp. E15-1]